MKVTFILQDLTEDYLNSIKSRESIDCYQFLNKQSYGDMKHCIKQKIGNGSFRDRVELNQLLRTAKNPAVKFESRRGYILSTFTF